jgi:hemolysin III
LKKFKGEYLKITPKTPTRKEEIGNFITHTVGTGLAITGLVMLIIRAVRLGGALRIVSFTIFGVTLVLLYVASSLYHGLPIIVKSARLHKVLRIFDHSAIFLLIAGSYTPFMLVKLRGSMGLSLFYVVWAIALVGIVLKVIFINKYPALFTAIYIAMGWLIVIAIKPLIVALPKGSIVLLFLGGLTYTLGVIFYAWQKLQYNHFIWHFFVLFGSIFHYFAILFYV